MGQRERELEQAVVDSWPAAETHELDGWLLRASGGPTHRGNSVATLCAGRKSLELRIRETINPWTRQPITQRLGTKKCPRCTNGCTYCISWSEASVSSGVAGKGDSKAATRSGSISSL